MFFHPQLSTQDHLQMHHHYKIPRRFQLKKLKMKQVIRFLDPIISSKHRRNHQRLLDLHSTSWHHRECRRCMLSRHRKYPNPRPSLALVYDHHRAVSTLPSNCAMHSTVPNRNRQSGCMMTALLRCSCTGAFPYHRILLVPRHCPRFPRYLHHQPHLHFHWLYMPPKRKQPKRRTQSQTTFSSLFLPLIFRLFAPEVVSPVHPATSSPLGGSPIALYERDIIYRSEEHTSDLQSCFDLVYPLLL